MPKLISARQSACLLSALLILLAACSPDSSSKSGSNSGQASNKHAAGNTINPTAASTSKEMKVKTDLQELARLIQLPAGTSAASWEIIQESSGGGLGPNDWSVLAILHLPQEALNGLLAQSTAQTADPGQLAALQRPWLAAADKQHLQGNISQVYPATAFFKSPLQQGFFLPLPGSGQILLYLYTQ